MPLAIPPFARRGIAMAGRTIGAIAAAFLLVTAPGPAQAFAERDLVEGFMLTVFGGEAAREAGAASGYVKKFSGPIAYHLVSTARVDRRRTVRGFLAGLERVVQHLSFTEVRGMDDAQMVIFLVDRADYVATIRTTVWPGVDVDFLETNACSAVIAARRAGIDRAFVYIVADEGTAGFQHCMVEEITQSLGPANDSPRLADSIFNDDSRLNTFGLFDWYLLNMLYDARVMAGMNAAAVRPVLPAAIADARRRLPHALARREAGRGNRGAFVAPLP